MFATDLRFGYHRDISPYLLPGLLSFYCTSLGSEFLSNSIPTHFTWLKQGIILQPIHLRCTVCVHRMIYVNPLNDFGCIGVNHTKIGTGQNCPERSQILKYGKLITSIP
jgi:hypothetical protein